MRNEHLPAGWAWDPFATYEIHDTCPNCGAAIDDDTEVFFAGQIDDKPAEVIGCEHCMFSLAAYYANRHDYASFDEYRTDTATGFPEKVDRDA